MRVLPVRRGATVLAAVVLMGAAAAQAPAALDSRLRGNDGSRVAALQAEGAWARPTVPGQDSSGAYMTLTARAPLTLLGADTPAAGIVEIHQMKMEGDVMRMRAADALPLPVGQPVKLAPGGYHFMLMDLKQPFRAGSRIPMTLRLRDAKGRPVALQVRVPVQAMAPAAAAQR